MDNGLYKKQFGDMCEDFAERWFLAKGCGILGRNVRFREGEIDLIVVQPAQGGSELLFVEVKGRRSLEFGGVVEALTRKKMQRMQRAVARWRRESGDRRPGRFVFLGIYQRADGGWEVDEVDVE